MIEINLLPEEFRKKESIRLALPAIQALPKKTVLIVVGVAAGLQLLFTGFAFFQKWEVSAVKQEIAQLKENSRNIVRQKNESTQIRTRLLQIDQTLHRRFFWSSLLSALTDSTIRGVWLTQLSTAEGNVSPMIKKIAPETASPRKSVSSVALKSSKMLKLEGSVVGPGEETALIGKFIKKLKSNALFETLFAEIEPSTINQKKIREFDVYDFTIACVFKEGMVETVS